MTTRDALRLLQAEIVQVVGCTEPAAIAYALRTLVRHTQAPPSPETFRAELRISVDARRNATTAVVPRLKQPGIHAAAAAGLASRADDFNVFSDFDLPLARAFLKKENWLTIIPVRRRGLWVHAQLPGQRTGITLSGRHDHIERLVIYGEDRTPRTTRKCSSCVHNRAPYTLAVASIILSAMGILSATLTCAALSAIPSSKSTTRPCFICPIA